MTPRAVRHAQVTGEFDVDDTARRGLRARRRCAATTCRRSPTARCAVVIARADKARELCENPVWITGFAHCSRAALSGHARLCASHATTGAAKAAGIEEAPVRGGRDPGGVHARGAAAVEALGLGPNTAINPSGGPLAAEPHHGHRPGPSHRSGPGRSATAGKHRTLRALDVGAVPAAEPRVHPGRE